MDSIEATAANLKSVEVDEFLLALALREIPPLPSETRRRVRLATLRLLLIPVIALVGIAVLVGATVWWFLNGQTTLEPFFTPRDQGAGIVYGLVLAAGPTISFMLMRSIVPLRRAEFAEGIVVREVLHPVFHQWMNGVATSLGVQPPTKVRIVVGTEFAISAESCSEVALGRYTLWVGNGTIASLSLLQLTTVFSAHLVGLSQSGGPRAANVAGRMSVWSAKVGGAADRSAASTITSPTYLLARMFVQPILKGLERSSTGSVGAIFSAGEDKAWDMHEATFGAEGLACASRVLEASSASFDRLNHRLTGLAESFALPRDLGEATREGMEDAAESGLATRGAHPLSNAPATALFRDWSTLSEKLTAGYYLENFGYEEGVDDWDAYE